MFYWVVHSDDGAYAINSIVDFGKKFETQEEAYNHMRDAALEKMKWNTDYREDYDETWNEDDPEIIDYTVHFSQGKIVHSSYSGTYTYEIKQESTAMENFKSRLALHDISCDPDKVMIALYKFLATEGFRMSGQASSKKDLIKRYEDAAQLIHDILYGDV